MSYTNHTTNYNLPQYIGTDKPTYLGDFNSAMSAIDSQMKLNADTASTAGTNATTATTNIGTLASLTTDVKTDLVSAINEVDTNADTAQTTANSANTIAGGCRTDLNKFNLTNRTNLSPTINLGTLSPLTSVQFATDTTNSIFKLYGRVTIENLANLSGNLTVKLGDTSLRPNEAYEINSGVMIAVRNSQGAFSGIGSRNLKINTDGSVYAIVPNENYVLNGLTGITASVELIISPCLYFNTNFGDN